MECEHPSMCMMPPVEPMTGKPVMDRGQRPLDVKGYIHSIETGGTVDGPGIRFILFLNGCPLRCQYCHNPDAMKKRDGKIMKVSSILEEIKEYKDFLMRSGGGVTISGGEPLMQPQFVEGILRGCRAMGLHTAIDTSGYLGRNAYASILNQTDLFLLDIKSSHPETYQKVTGVQLQPTLDFAQLLDREGKECWIRFVLVPGLTDAAHNIRGVASFVASLSNVSRIEILPFHKMGEHKWAQLGLPYALESTPAATEKDVQRARDIFTEFNLQVC